MQIITTRFINIFLILKLCFGFDHLCYSDYKTYLRELEWVSQSYFEIITLVYKDKIIISELSTGFDKFINDITLKIKYNENKNKINDENILKLVKVQKKEYEGLNKDFKTSLKENDALLHKLYTHLYKKNRHNLKLVNIYEYKDKRENDKNGNISCTEEKPQKSGTISKNNQKNNKLTKHDEFLSHINEIFFLINEILKVSIADALINVEYHYISSKPSYLLKKMKQYLYKFTKKPFISTNKLEDIITDKNKKTPIKLMEACDKVKKMLEKAYLVKICIPSNQRLKDEIDMIFKIHNSCFSLLRSIYNLHGFFLECSRDILRLVDDISVEDLKNYEEEKYISPISV